MVWVSEYLGNERTLLSFGCGKMGLWVVVGMVGRLGSEEGRVDVAIDEVVVVVVVVLLCCWGERRRENV